MIVAIDVGSHKICTLVGEAIPGGGLRLLGVGHAPAGGIRAGEVVHVDEAAGAIAASVERAERVAGMKIDRATIGITSPSFEGSNNRALLPCGRHPRAITSEDIDRALDVAGTVPLGPDRTALHVLPRYFEVDDGGPVVSPLNMEGHRLQVDVHIVTAATAAVGNLRRCLAMAEVAPTGLVMSTLAAAEAVLTRDERDLGVVVVDLGAAVTGLACYCQGALAHTATLAIGGRDMTNDLSVTLQTPLAEAERIKAAHGHALPELDDDPTDIEITVFGDDERRLTDRRTISEVLAARVDTLAERIAAELQAAGMGGQLAAGAVLVGGGTELAGLPRRFSARWGMPVRVGRPGKVIGLADGVRGPGHAGVVGLLLWTARGARDAAVPSPAPARDAGSLARAWDWLRTVFLPGSDRHSRLW